MHEISLFILMLFLVAAAWGDFVSFRIPNALILMGVVTGLLLRYVSTGWTGLSPGVAGLLVGIAVMLPMYWLNAMGAGDVKLMGMTGVFLGPGHILGAWLLTLLAGGVLALVYARHYRKLDVMWQGVKHTVIDAIHRNTLRQMPIIEVKKISAGRLPYALSIALGTAAYLIWQHENWLGVH